MADLSGFPYAEVQFDSGGGVLGGTDAVRALAGQADVTDLWVFGHGWNNDADGARQLYGALAASLRAVFDSGAVPALAGRRPAIAGTIWPSKQFADLVASGSHTAAVVAPESDGARVLAGVQRMRAVFPGPQAQRTLDRASALVPKLPNQEPARAEFAESLRSLVSPAAASPDDASTEMFAVSGDILMSRLARPPAPAPARAGGAWDAATNLLNYLTFYEMKARAGTVGTLGLAPLLSELTRPGLRLHLVGHSFGARLVTAAAGALTGDKAVSTLSLLQGAFSQYGFADNWGTGRPGYFRPVIDRHRVTGPMLITYTVNDVLLGIAYALASRVAGDFNADLVAPGGATDLYGALGHNGALNTPEAVPATLLPVGGAYSWRPGAPHNLLSDQFISGHSDVAGQQVAYALLSGSV
ncbi:hypothetical protein [Pseudonocardia spinosispora]|uniref:hypothetical protein n=1 Tax=Pseudonocardia spinosispora TaxID=103441 RepID=UPI0003F565EE|nr:hypothetical protein [Pseudonocardia spinosispora]